MNDTIEVYEILNEMCISNNNNTQQIFEDNAQQIELIYKTYINY